MGSGVELPSIRRCARLRLLCRQCANRAQRRDRKLGLCPNHSRQSPRVKDTVAFVRLAKSAINTTSSKGAITSMNITINPWGAEDDWVVTPDGRVGIVRNDGYRLDWIDRMVRNALARASRIRPFLRTRTT